MKHTFLLQNNVSKETYSWILDDLTPESIYHKFEIELKPDMDNAEYEYILIENPNELEIDINPNDIFKSQLIGGDTIVESFGLVRIGGKGCHLQYDKKQIYITYDE